MGKFEDMSNIFPKNSNLPFTIWISHSLKNKYNSPKIKVEVDNNSYSVTISDNPKWIQKPKGISEKKLNEVIEWIILNKQTLLDHWNGKTDSVDLANNLKKLS